MWAPPPPRQVQAAAVSSTEIRVSWTPPTGFEELQPGDMPIRYALAPRFRAAHAVPASCGQCPDGLAALDWFLCWLYHGFRRWCVCRYSVTMQKVLPPEDSALFGDFVPVATSDDTHIVIGDLEPESPYQFRISACNEAGVGPPADPTDPVSTLPAPVAMGMMALVDAEQGQQESRDTSSKVARLLKMTVGSLLVVSSWLSHL